VKRTSRTLEPHLCFSPSVCLCASRPLHVNQVIIRLDALFSASGPSEVPRSSTVWESASMVCSMAADVLMHVDCGTPEDSTSAPNPLATPRGPAGLLHSTALPALPPHSEIVRLLRVSGVGNHKGTCLEGTRLIEVIHIMHATWI
jgi:hypothetical protein